MAKRIATFALMMALLFSTGVCRAQAEGGIIFEKDLVYGSPGGEDLYLDMARPETGDGPFPGIVCIHGGGWKAGNKAKYQGAIKEFARAGFVAVTVQYRLAPKAKFPAQIEDCKCAVRYLRCRAGELKMDPKRIGAMGESAGGHLSLLLGLMNPEDGLEGDGGHPTHSSKVQAVVNYYGPADFKIGFTGLSILPGSRTIMTYALRDFLGTTDPKSPILERVSPVTYIDANDPPVLTMHGSADRLVPVAHARQLHAKLKKAGVDSRLVVVNGADHGWGGEEAQRTSKMAMDFMVEKLKGGK
ncbi:MAG TPA: alpha/beta hydrolase [Candidatus Brocadiia bacterium]|nr:alpha/beta hydrolase [Candidatus Brocadiia bacterium]